MSLFQGIDKTATRLLGAAVLAVPLFSAPLSATEEAKDAVAQLGTTQYTASEFKNFLATLDPKARSQALANPRVMNQLVQLQLVRKALFQEALTKKWQQKPEIAKQINGARDAIILKTYLASVANLPADYPSDVETRAAYDLNRARFLMPRRYRLEQIYVAIAPTDKNGAAALQKAKSLAAKARDGRTRFEDLARKNSQHKTSAEQGGDTGWLAEGDLLPEIRARIQGMAKGEVSEPIRAGEGWHIVRLMDTQAAGPQPLAEVRPMIVASLRQQKAQAEQQKYIVRLLQKSPITIREAQLRAAVK